MSRFHVEALNKEELLKLVNILRSGKPLPKKLFFLFRAFPRVKGLAQTEISEILGCSRESVNRHLNRLPHYRRKV